MKGFCLSVDGIDGTIAPIENSLQTYDEMSEIMAINPEEVEKEKQENLKELQKRLKRCKIKIFKIRMVKEIPLEKILMENEDD